MYEYEKQLSTTDSSRIKIVYDMHRKTQTTHAGIMFSKHFKRFFCDILYFQDIILSIYNTVELLVSNW